MISKELIGNEISGTLVIITKPSRIGGEVNIVGNEEK